MSIVQFYWFGAPPGCLFYFSIYSFFSCFGKKRIKRSRVKGRFEQMRPLYNPPPPHWKYYRNIFALFCSYNRAPRERYIGEGAPDARERGISASPMLTSLVTFLFSDKKVTYGRLFTKYTRIFHEPMV